MSEAAPETPPTGTSRFYTQAELDAERERVRAEEKSKLYPKIEATDARMKILEDEVKEHQKFRKAQEKIEADRVKAIEDAQKAKADAEMSAKDFAAKQREQMEARVAQLQAENDAKMALMEQEIKFSRLQAYIQRRVTEEQNFIAPELVDFINGEDEAAVEASIEVLKAKTAQIMENVKNAGRLQRTGMTGIAPVAGSNAVGPLDGPGDRQYTAEDIRGMPLSEYAALRTKIKMPSGSGRGLFD